MNRIVQNLLRLALPISLLTLFSATALTVYAKEPGTDDRPQVRVKSIPVTDAVNDRVSRRVEAIDETDVAITIGNGTSTQRYPIHEYFWFSRSQALYTSAEIGQGGLITFVRWYPTVARTWLDTSSTKQVKIYLGTTTATTLSASSYSTTGLTLVYQNDHYTGTTTAYAWQNFDISDFAYNGTDNLLVVTEVNLTGYSTPQTGEGYQYTTTGSNRFQYWEQDNTAPTGSGVVGTNRPNIQFEFSTTAPSSPSIGSPANGATSVPVTTSVTWTTGANTNNVDVYFSQSSALVTSLDTTVRVLSAVPTATVSYTPPTQLIAGVVYYWRVVARNSTTGELAPSNVWSFTTTSPPLTGTKTVGGTSPNYNTFTDAINALIAYGVGTGGVTFNVRSGTYNERLVIPSITGASSTNRIVFQKETGTVTLAATGTSGTTDALVKFNGAKYVTFSGIDVQDNGSTNADFADYGYYVTNSSVSNGCTGIIISGCSITLHRTNSYSIAVYQALSFTPTSQAGANNDNHYLDLKIANCVSPVSVSGNSSWPDSLVEIGSTTRGTSYAGRFTVGNGGIDDDIGSGSSCYGIYVSYAKRVLIHDCDVQNLFTTSTGSSIIGVYLVYTSLVSEVSGVRVRNLRSESGNSGATTSMYGMYLTANSGEIRCYNNFISGFYHPRTAETTSIYLFGIYTASTSGYCYVDHNSIALNPNNNGASSTCVYVNNYTYLRNNIFENLTPYQFTAKHYLIFCSGSSYPVSNNNLFYSPNLYGAIFAYQNYLDRLGIEDWRYNTGQDASSQEGIPRFVNEATGDLHIQTGVLTPVMNSGTQVSWATLDIEGTTRNTVAPDIGANEGNFNSTTPLSGTKTIGGANPDYANFISAIDALTKYGIGAGGVVFSVRPGIYPGALTIPYLPDATNRTPVTFRKESTAVTVTATGTQGAYDAVLRLIGCDYVTFDGIDFADSGSTSSNYVEYGVWIGGTGRKGATNDSIKNATLTMHRANLSSYGVYQYSYYTPVTTTGENNYNRYLNLKITNAHGGVYLNGNSSYWETGNEIGSTSTDLNYAGRFTIGSGGLDDIGGGNGTTQGIYSNYQIGLRIHDCDIINLFSNTSGYSVFGVYLYYPYGTTTVTGNRIYNLRQTAAGSSTTGNLYGIYTQYGDEVRINNNFISGFSHARSSETSTLMVYGIYHYYAANFFCDYNSILIGTGAQFVTSTAIYTSYGNQYLRNNNIISKVPNQTTAKHYGINYGSGGTLQTSNYNCFYMPFTGNAFIGYYTSDRISLDDWQTYSGKDYNSVLGDPRFRDEASNDLRIQTGVYTPVNAAGTPVTQVTTDIYGNSRSGSTPDIGPEEAAFVSATPLTGTKTIGGINPDYPTFGAAVAALQLYGVGTGGVTFNVRPGTYNEQVVVTPIYNTSTSNPVIFQLESTNPTIATTGASIADAAVKLVGCSWVTFDGINVSDLGTSSTNYIDYGYWVTNYTGARGAANNTIKNATITLNRINTSSYGIYQNLAFTPTTTIGANSSNHYLNLKITNCRNGVYLYGNSSYRDQYNEIGSVNASVTDTTRFVIGSGGGDDIGGTSGSCYGIYLYYQEAVRIHDIDISNVFAGAYSNSAFGIYSYYLYGTNDISNNRIYNIHNSSGDANATGSLYGAYLYGASTSEVIRFYNNTISGFNHPRTTETSSIYLYGITCPYGTIYADNNSFLMNSPNSGASNTCVYSNGSTLSLRNNVFVNRTANTTSAYHYAIYHTSGTLSSSNYNLFYIPNLSNGCIGYYSSAQVSLDAWQSYTGQDYSSRLGNPFYANEPGNDLRIMSGTASPVNNNGTQVTWITRDIEGNTRNNPPDIGVSEGNFVSSAPLTGTKTVGGITPDYNTFADAMTALQLYGVGTSGVTFNVRPGTYNELVTAYPVVGASTNNPIVFQRESGAVTIATVGTAAANDAGIRLIGASWYTFDGISVTDLGTSSSNYLEYGYYITNYTGSIGSTNNTIKNATITLNRVNASSYGLYQYISFAPTTQAGANNTNHYLNLKITNCRNGVYLYGNSGYHDQNCEIGSLSTNLSDTTRFVIGSGGGDDIGGASSTNYGVNLYYQESVRVHDIDISNVFASTSNYTAYGIYAYNLYGTSEVSNNRIYGIHNSSGDVNATGSVYGASISAYNTSHVVRFYNNTISGFAHPRTTETGVVYIWGFYTSNGTVYFDNNSVSIAPATSGSTTVCLYCAGATIYVRNNIFVNRTASTTTANHVGLDFYSGSLAQANYNLYYIPNSGNGYVGWYNATGYATIDAWQNYTGQDYQSRLGNPFFANETGNDLRIQPGTASPVNNNGTNVTWITRDIEGTTRNGSTPDIGAQEGNFVSASPLTGTKTVGGTTPDYNTFADAMNALQQYGVGTGGVIFNVRPGTYNEIVTAYPTTGASASNPIIFQRESGVVTVASTGTSASGEAGIRLIGADYYTFNGINVTDLGTGSSTYLDVGYWVTNQTGSNGASNNVIKNATITLNRTNLYSYGIYQTNWQTASSQAGANNSNKYLNLKITNCRFGVYLYGTSYYRDQYTEVGSISPLLTDTTRFTIGSGGADDIGSTSHTYGINAYYQETIRIHDCDIANLVSNTSGSTVAGVYFNTCYGVNEVSANRIYNLRNGSGDINSTGSVYGIYLYPSTATGAEVRCFNNTISGLNHPRTAEGTTVYVTGIYTGQGTCYVDYNSILLNPTVYGHTNTCINVANTSTYLTMRNNILVNKTPNQSTARHYGIYYSNAGSFTSNNNLFYIPYTTTGHIGYWSGDRNTIDAWQTYTGYDYYSKIGNPFFANEAANDLRIMAGTASPANNTGANITWVTTDIEGNTRNGSTPDIGCDEGNFVSGSPLTGTKTIGGIAPDYATFADALNALQMYGVGTGGVIFQVRPGIYYEQPVVYPIVGTSATNPVIFRKQSNAVTFAPVGTSATNDAAIKLVGCSYVTFDGIDVSDSLNSGVSQLEYGYRITNYTGTRGATYNTIQNCTITLNRSNSNSTMGIFQVTDLTPTSSAGANSYNKYLNLKLGNSVIGIYLTGDATYHDIGTEIGSNPTDLTASSRMIIGFNGANDIGGTGNSYGVYPRYQEAIRIHDCDIGNIYNSVSSNSVYGIYLYNSFGISEISGNRIYGLRNTVSDVNSNASLYGIYASVSTTGTNEVRIFSNFISGFTHPRTTETTSLYMYGISVSGTAYIDNNTIVLNPNTIGSSNTCVYGANTTMTLRNNIFLNVTGNQVTAKHYGIYCGTTTTVLSNYNLFQIVNNNGMTGYYNAGQYNTLANWRSTTGQDNNSVTGDPLLVDFSSYNLHVQMNIETPVSNAGTTVTWVTRDIDSETRSSPPDIGADEGMFGFIVVTPSPANGATTVTTNAVLSWNPAANATGYDVYLATTTPPTIVSSNQAGTTYTPGGGLLRNQLYYWKVIPRTAGGPGSGVIWSFTTGNGSTPNSPTGGSITGIASNSLTMNWVDNSTDETGFVVKSSTDSIAFSTLTTTLAGVTNYQHNPLSVNARYWYRVYATNATGNSIGYASANAWTLANAPQIPTLGSVGITYVQVTPQNAAVANPAYTQYAIYESRTGQYVQGDGTLGASAVWRLLSDWATITVTNLAATAPYNFTVKARNGAGIETAFSPTLATTTMPINEQFNNATFPPLGWSVTNPDAGITWVRYNGTNAGNGAVWVNFPSYFPGSDQQDMLWTPFFSTLGAGNATVSFNWWYQSGYAANDGLEVFWTPDNGTTMNSLWLRRGASTNPALGTGTAGSTSYPALANWGSATLTLPFNALELPSLKIGFRSYNQYGPALFLDNVQVNTTPLPRFAFNPASYSFGNVTVNTTGTSSGLWVVNRNATSMQITSATVATTKFHILSGIPFTIGANDSALFSLSCTPDTTLIFRDTLQVQFTDGTPVSLPLSGTGYGYYASLSQTTYSFPNVIEPTRSDSATVLIRVKGNAPITSATFVTLAGPFAGGPQPWITVNSGDSGVIKLYFRPTIQGVFTGSLGIIVHAINVDTLRITLSGTAHYVPAPPGGLTITRSGENANLSWARVDTSLNGVPLTVDRYIIYYRDNGSGPWYYLAYNTGANTITYNHVGVVTYSPAMYYRVTAVINTSSSDRILRELQPGTPERVVKQLLSGQSQ